MSENQQLRQVFVCHAHEDSAWCNAFVGALRQAGTDVWYDEHNLGYGRISRYAKCGINYLAMVPLAANTM